MAASVALTPTERFLRDLARLLAPFLEEELARPRPVVSSTWDESTCALYASRLPATVARRALVLFERLADVGKISSVELAGLLGVKPKGLGGVLTTSLKRHAKALGVPLPFDGGDGSLLYGGAPEHTDDDDPQRTYWVDRDGIAARLVRALRARLEGEASAQ